MGPTRRRGFERSLAGGILLAVSLIVFAQILSRYCLHRSIAFTEEITRHLFIWATMLGAAAATREDSHLGIRLVSRWLPPLGQKILRLAGCVGMAALFLVVFITSLSVLRVQIETKQLTPALGWSICWASSAVTIGCALIVIRSALRFKQRLSSAAPRRESNE